MVSMATQINNTRIPLLRRPRPPRVEDNKVKDSLYTNSWTTSRPVTRISESIAQQTTGPRSAAAISCTTAGRRAPPNTMHTHYHGDVQEKEPFVINSLHPKGPKPLPCRAPIRRSLPLDTTDKYYYHEWTDGYEGDDGFTLNDMMRSLPSDEDELLSLTPPKLPIMSKHNYEKLVGWFAVYVPTQSHINTTTIEADSLECPEQRKPLRQFLIELQAMVKEMCSEELSTEEDTDTSPICQRGDEVMTATTSKYFCGEGRSGSPFSDADQVMIEPSEVAILQCMMQGGTNLSLKAHFLDTLPDLYPVTHTLHYLNVSFNDLRTFPNKIIQCGQLACLKMRNNPIREIPNNISLLKHLRIFCISFCLLSDLPTGLFELNQLEQLDISHNILKWISPDIRHLSQLQKLNAEGNQLEGFPPGLMQLPLKQLNTEGNLLHMLLWSSNAHNQPQRLSELCQVTISQYGLPNTTSDPTGTCDCCKGSVFGVGLRVIRHVTTPPAEIFHHLPFIFIVCSPTCHRNMRRHCLK